MPKGTMTGEYQETIEPTLCRLLYASWYQWYTFRLHRTHIQINSLKFQLYDPQAIERFDSYYFAHLLRYRNWFIFLPIHEVLYHVF